MQMHASRPLYYFLVTITTQLIIAVGALAMLLPTGLLALLPLPTLGALMAYNVVIATFVAAILSGQEGQNQQSIQRGAGLVLGHLAGLVLGGFFGAYFGGPAWAIGGAVVLYFVAGWIGSRISLAIGGELERLAVSTYEPGSRIEVRGVKRDASFLFFYGAVIPLMFMTAAMLVRTPRVPLAPYVHVLPTARIVLMLLSACSIALPWLRRAELSRREPGVRFAGLGLSLAPALYGFLLFMAFGLSMAELSLFAVAAAIAATTWGMQADAMLSKRSVNAH